MSLDCTKPNGTSPSSAADAGLHKSLGAAAALRLMPLAEEQGEEVESSIEPLVTGLLDALGEDPSREGLEKTPQRVAKSLRFLTSGYATDLEDVVNGAVFDAEGYGEMVLVRDIEFYSLCEHHMLPFFGKVSVAYVPSRRIIGLSKVPRLVEVFARRLQVQERLTQQIAQALEEILAPRGVAVSVNGTHLCMAMRGVEKQMSTTKTFAFTGVFEADRDVRREFLAQVGKA